LCPHLGVYCTFEGRQRFRQIGINLNVLQPGQPMGMYHRENAQEGFLVLAGECRLIVEGEERRLVAWDFFHCPSGTEHVLVGSGDAPAARYGASVERETRDAREAYGAAYADLPRSKWIPCSDGWLPED
jgi:uncharacterized cupin superfamily protein